MCAVSTLDLCNSTLTITRLQHFPQAKDPFLVRGLGLDTVGSGQETTLDMCLSYTKLI